MCLHSINLFVQARGKGYQV